MERTPTLTGDEHGTDEPTVEAATDAVDDVVEDELLVEEVSIDGMCGVY